MEIQLTRLTALVEQGFEDTRREVRELKDYQREMNGKVARAYERLASIDTAVAGHDGELGRVRKRMHELANQAKATVETSMENIKPTWKGIGQALGVIGATTWFTYWFLTALMGFHR